MATISLENTGKYYITSIGNGIAYEIGNKTTGQDAFLQGDDADIFRKEYDAMGEAYSNPKSVWHNQTWDQCLAELCDELISAANPETVPDRDADRP